MKLISHRGNLYGPNHQVENKPEQILECLQIGFDVEIDVWKVDEKYYLGHDSPEYEVEIEFLRNNRLWCHAKNQDCLEILTKDIEINVFWHQTDDYTLTSKGFIWCYPGKELPTNSVAVMPENTEYSLEYLKRCYALCTDYPLRYRELLLNKGVTK